MHPSQTYSSDLTGIEWKLIERRHRMRREERGEGADEECVDANDRNIAQDDLGNR